MFAKGIGIGSLMLFAFSLAAAAPLADRPRTRSLQAMGSSRVAVLTLWTRRSTG